MHPDAIAILESMRLAADSLTGPVFGKALGDKLKAFKRDLQAAGIPYVNDIGQRCDFHALCRVSPNTHLAQLGVGERIRQAFMRHSDPKLTNGVYTDANQLPTASAVRSLPALRQLNALENALTSDISSPEPSRAVKLDSNQFWELSVEYQYVSPDLSGDVTERQSEENGGPGRTRTYDQEIMSLLL